MWFHSWKTIWFNIGYPRNGVVELLRVGYQPVHPDTLLITRNSWFVCCSSPSIYPNIIQIWHIELFWMVLMHLHYWNLTSLNFWPEVPKGLALNLFKRSWRMLCRLGKESGGHSSMSSKVLQCVCVQSRSRYKWNASYICTTTLTITVVITCKGLWFTISRCFIEFVIISGRWFQFSGGTLW
jgi:hypothetical protein